MVKRFLFVVTVMGLGLAACTGAPEGEPAEEAEAPAEPAADLPDIPELAFEGVTRNADWEPVIEEFDGVPMALVPAGCFMMGSSNEAIDQAFDLCEQVIEDGECDRAWFENELPQREVCFEQPFWIDVYEVTNAQYGSPGIRPGDDRPRENVNWYNAGDHCQSRGARLPTEAEWEYAARGPDGLAFPWGYEFDGTLANYCDSNCEFAWSDADADDDYTTTAPVGSYPDGVSWVGALDMSGNVWEWADDWYGEYPSEAQVNPRGPGSGQYRVVRGGSWRSYAFGLRIAAHGGLPPDVSYEVGGFRCALTIDPAYLTP